MARNHHHFNQALVDIRQSFLFGDTGQHYPEGTMVNEKTGEIHYPWQRENSEYTPLLPRDEMEVDHVEEESGAQDRNIDQVAEAFQVGEDEENQQDRVVSDKAILDDAMTACNNVRSNLEDGRKLSQRYRQEFGHC